MKKTTIVQFVCFATDLEYEEFEPKWERYAKRLMNSNPETTLQQHTATKSKFRYISQHEWLEGDFSFTFMNKKGAEHFPEHNVKVVQIGGYTLLHKEHRKHKSTNDSVKLIAFVSHDENEIDFYKELPFFSQLNIYQPYYESCTYGYVMEFFVPEENAAELAQQIKHKKGAETGIYKECLAYNI